MVQLLLLSSTKGNSGQRFFPYTGYLGLTPVRVEGVVRTKLDADLKPLQAKAITISVRCYETRTGRVNVLQSKVLVDYTHTLWSKPDNQDFENIGNTDFPFRMSVPANVAGYSTATFVDYRCVWRVEAVLHHNYIHGVGSRQIRYFDLPLIRYDVPFYPALPSSSLDQVTTKLRAPRIKYSLRPPSTPIGPLDLVSVPIHLQPVDSSVSIRSASMFIERRIQLFDIQPATPPPTSSPPQLKKALSSSSLSSPNTSKELSSIYQSSLVSYDTYNSDSPDPSLLAVNLYSHPSLPPHSKSTEYNYDPQASTSSLASSIPTITPGTVYPSSSAASVVSESTPLIQHSQDSHSSSSQSQSRLLSHSHSRSISHTFSPTVPASSGHYEPISSTTTTDISSASSSLPPSSTLSPPKTIVNAIADVSSSGKFIPDGNGVFSKTLTLQWPAAKSQSRWAVGETIKGSDLVSVRFFIRTKITVSSPSGTETIDLADQELLVVSTNEAERQLALAKWNEMVEASGQSASEGNVNRSKSKSPRRAARDRGKDDPRQGRSTGSVNEPEKEKEKSQRAKSSTRRPHTSAGPRDRFTNFAGGVFGAPVPVPDMDPRHQQGNIPPSSFKSASVVIDNLAAPKRRSDGASMAKSGGFTALNLGSLLSSSHDSQSSSKGKVSRPGSSSGRSKPTQSNSTPEPGSTAHPLLRSAPGGNGKVSSSSFWSTTHSNPRITSSSKNSKTKGKGINSQTSSSGSSRFSDASHGVNKSTVSAPGRVAMSHSTSTSGSTTSTSTSLSRSTSTSRTTDEEDDLDPCVDFSGKARRSRLDSVPSTQRPSTASSGRQPQPVVVSTDRNMREWEEELARIEMRSRRSSDLLGFAGKRSVRKAVGAVMKAFGSGDS